MARTGVTEIGGAAPPRSGARLPLLLSCLKPRRPCHRGRSASAAGPGAWVRLVGRDQEDGMRACHGRFHRRLDIRAAHRTRVIRGLARSTSGCAQPGGRVMAALCGVGGTPRRRPRCCARCAPTSARSLPCSPRDGWLRRWPATPVHCCRPSVRPPRPSLSSPPSEGDPGQRGGTGADRVGSRAGRPVLAHPHPGKAPVGHPTGPTGPCGSRGPRTSWMCGAIPVACRMLVRSCGPRAAHQVRPRRR